MASDHAFEIAVIQRDIAHLKQEEKRLINVLKFGKPESRVKADSELGSVIEKIEWLSRRLILLREKS